MYKTPVQGDPVGNLFSATMWRDIVAMVNEWKAGRPGSGEEDYSPSVLLLNTILNPAQDREQGDLQIPGKTTGVTDDDRDGWLTNPTFQIGDPTWPHNLDSPVILGQGIDADVRDSFTSGDNYQAVTCSDYQAGDEFVMFDPAAPWTTKSSDAGIYKILSYDGDARCVVDTRVSQPLWKYELTVDASSVIGGGGWSGYYQNTKLLRLDGTEYSDNIWLYDEFELMDDQKIGDQGYCLFTGGKFYAIQAPCV